MLEQLYCCSLSVHVGVLHAAPDELSCSSSVIAGSGARLEIPLVLPRSVVRGRCRHVPTPNALAKVPSTP